MFYTLRKFTVIISFLLCSLSVSASNIEIGSPLPAIQILDFGECVVKENEAVFQPWDSTQLIGTVSIVEYAAARAGIDKVHAGFYAAVSQSNLPAEKISIIRLINSSDAIWGASSMVLGEIKKRKLASPEENFVVDGAGEGLKAWGLDKKQAYIAILDASGNVLFFKKGAMEDAEIEVGIELVKAQIF